MKAKGIGDDQALADVNAAQNLPAALPAALSPALSPCVP